MSPTLSVRTPNIAPYRVGDVIADKYRLDELIGEGGMGTVWRGFNLQLEAPVALKLIRAELDQGSLGRRLKQEARAAAKLGHSAIVRVFDVGDTELGDPYIVMELLNGQTLGSLLDIEQRLSAVRCLQLLLPVADALAAAHAKGIVHRDLKPDNIFLSLEADQLRPKLLDFGIAKLESEAGQNQQLTQSGAVLGSPGYMSPEQARGQSNIDHRTDIWSFSVVLYETLSGTSPFTGANYNSLMRSIVEDEPASLVTQLAADPPLWEIVQRGLCKNVEHRFATMNELGRALAEWLFNQGVFEDVSGVSLDSKWLTRSLPAGRGSRASFASLAGLTPPSGVRTTQAELWGAPTIGVATAPAALTPGPKAAWPRRNWIALAALTVATGGAALLVWKHDRPSPSQAAERPSVAPPPARPQAIATSRVEPIASVVISSNPTPNVPSEATAPSSASARIAAPRPNKTRPAASNHHAAPASDAQRDLLAPY
ncbi:MAG TPA: protein kinase [Polyangiaceae bacterium]|nr:protein kinase [Polyangiaceae bacterium]